MRQRNFGIEFLRILLMYMVCMLHTISQGGILASYSVGSTGYIVFLFLRTLSEGAVDGFALISGYVATNRKTQKYEKLIDMWFQAFFYSFIVTVILIIAGIPYTYGLSELVKCALPVTFNKFWYFTAYFILFLAIPLLNRVLFELDEKTAKRCFLVIFGLFTTLGLIADAFKTEYGYSVFWLIILYCMGVLARRIRLFENKKNLQLLIIWLSCIVIAWAISLATGVMKLLNYNSPLILMGALVLVILFSHFSLKGTIIFKISPMVFAVYLLQLNMLIFRDGIKDRMAFVVNHSIVIAVLYAFGFAGILFIAGILVEIIRIKLFRLLKLHSLSIRIVRVISDITSSFEKLL